MYKDTNPKKIYGLWPRACGITWRHRSRDHSIRGETFPMRGLLRSRIYLSPSWRYGASINVRHTDGRTDGRSGDFILCPMLCSALERQLFWYIFSFSKLHFPPTRKRVGSWPCDESWWLLARVVFRRSRTAECAGKRWPGLDLWPM